VRENGMGDERMMMKKKKKNRQAFNTSHLNNI